MTHLSKAALEAMQAAHGLDGYGPQSVIHPERACRPLFGTPLEHLDVEFVASTRTLWAHSSAAPRDAYINLGLMRDMRVLQTQLRQDAADRAEGHADPVRYFVCGSRRAGIFNLGGDLGLFAASIRRGDRAALSAYAHGCIDVVYANSIAFGLPIVTLALVQGDALGGGFEYALSFDVIVAERSVKLGLPEILFNLFPGMGAYSFLARRIGPARAQEMIMSGRIYSAEELHAMGIIDVLADDGAGAAAAADYIAASDRKYHAHQAIHRVRRRVNPVTEQELRDVVEIWVDTALALPEADLRKMERLAAAQDRRLRADGSGSAPMAVAAATGGRAVG